MTEVILTGILLKIFLGCVAVAGVMLALRLFDKYAGISFREGFDTIETDPKALALYFGLRLVALCIVMAGALL